MENLKIEATDSTPFILCDAKDGKIEFRGRSIPENATNFYAPVVNWIDNYAKEPGKKTKLEFHLDYINSISQKIILDILYKLEDVKKANGSSFNIAWCFEHDDEEMEDEGKIFASKVDLEFELVKMG